MKVRVVETKTDHRLGVWLSLWLWVHMRFVVKEERLHHVALLVNYYGMKIYVHERQHLGKKIIYYFQDHKLDNPFDQENNQQICNNELFDQIYVWVRDWWHNKDIQKFVDDYMKVACYREVCMTICEKEGV